MSLKKRASKTNQFGPWGEIINPSDKCHISIRDKTAAIAGVLLLGQGAYGLVGPSGESICPILIFGGAEQFLVEHFENFNEWLSKNESRVAQALMTVSYGSAAECESQMLALSLIDDLAKREQFIQANEDIRRSSLNEIVNRSRELAKLLMVPAKKASE